MPQPLLSTTNFPVTNLPTDLPGVGETSDLASAELAGATAAGMRMVTVRGRILNENGQPLVGATVINKQAGRGVGTDANGRYTLVLPANQGRELQFAYAGYQEENIVLKGFNTQNVTLLPTGKAAKKHRRWLLF